MLQRPGGRACAGVVHQRRSLKIALAEGERVAETDLPDIRCRPVSIDLLAGGLIEGDIVRLALYEAVDSLVKHRTVLRTGVHHDIVNAIKIATWRDADLKVTGALTVIVTRNEERLSGGIDIQGPVGNDGAGC